jgi:tetratricopeptide (TPR) repeat protein
MTAELLKKAGELADGEQPDEAMAICSQILVNEPDHPGALFVAGCILLKAQRHAHAIQFGKRIVQVCPKDHRGWELLCLVWGELHRYDESVRMAMKALACKRTDKTLADAAYAHVNCGNWVDGDKFSKAAILEAKTNPSARAESALRDATVSQAYCRLAASDWVPGFEGFRTTLRTKWRKEWTYGDSQEWMGESDAVVMVTGEQGLGDEIMAASVVPSAAVACVVSFWTVTTGSLHYLLARSRTY